MNPSETNELDRQPRKTFDVGSQRVARVYAEALLKAAEQHDEAEAILEEFHALVEKVFPAAPQFEAFLSSGAIGRDRKAVVIRETFQGRASELFLNFLLVLNHHDRLELLRAILTAAGELYDERKGRVRVQVRSAVPLPEDQLQRLRKELQETFHREPMLETHVEPDLLGGLIVRVGDWLYDASVKTQLATIRQQLIERSSHEIQTGRDRFCSANGN